MAKLYRYPAMLRRMQAPVVATLGCFDGLHLGHQALINRVRELCGLTGVAVLVSFYPRPEVVLRPDSIKGDILSPTQRIEFLSRLGVDVMYYVHFTPQFAQISAEEFLQRVLVEKLSVDILVVGKDVRVGHDRADVQFISAFLEKRGKKVEAIELLQSGGEKLSSRKVREFVVQGDVAQAARHLGRPFTLAGRVQPGQQRGSTLGFATANLAPRMQLLPKFGVYATRVDLKGKLLPAVTNVGIRPTFGGASPVIETHVIGYDPGECYGERIEVAFFERIRDEIKFESKEALKAQIERDIRKASELLPQIDFNEELL